MGYQVDQSGPGSEFCLPFLMNLQIEGNVCDSVTGKKQVKIFATM